MANLRNGAWRAPLLALVFLASYALITLGFPAPLNSLASIKMEVPELAQASINCAAFLRGSIVNLVMLSLAFGLAVGEKFAWWTGFVLSILFILPPLLMARTFVMMANGSMPVVMAPPIRVPPVLPWLILSGLAVLPPLIFLWLRRAFWPKTTPQTQTLRA